MLNRPLPLYEEILLLALDDGEGTTKQAGWYTNAMGGAILDECLALISEEKKTKSAAQWVSKFSGTKDLKNRVARQLVAKGLLAEETDTVLKIFKRTVYPEVDGGPEKELRERMKKAIFTATTEVEPRTVAIMPAIFVATS